MKPSDTTTYQNTLTQARAHRALKTKLSYFLRPYNMTMMQWAIVGSLHEAGNKGTRVSDLASRLDTSLAFVTTTLNVLEAKGIVRRANHAQDNRAKIVYLTDEFVPKVDEIEKEIGTKLKEWLNQSVTDQEFVTYLGVMEKIASIPQFNVNANYRAS